jgi:hypothetical protein
MKRFKIVGAMAMLVGTCLSSHAAILLPGGIGLDAPQAPGPAPLATLTTPFSFGGITGTITSWVVSDPANPLGGLSFYYQVTDTGTEAISRVSLSNFGIVPGVPVEVSTITVPFDSSLPGTISPVTATRSSLAGSTVGFNFSSVGLLPGQTSVIMVVNTSYPNFVQSTGAIIDSASVNVAILGPIPEPSTFMAGSLLLLPFAASALRIVRKRSTSLDQIPK